MPACEHYRYGESGAGGEAGTNGPLKDMLYVKEICQAVLKDYLKVLYLCMIFFLPPVFFRVFLIFYSEQPKEAIFLRARREPW